GRAGRRRAPTVPPPEAGHGGFDGGPGDAYPGASEPGRASPLRPARIAHPAGRTGASRCRRPRGGRRPQPPGPGDQLRRPGARGGRADVPPAWLRNRPGNWPAGDADRGGRVREDAARAGGGPRAGRRPPPPAPRPGLAAGPAAAPPDGVWLADLAPLTDPALVAPTAAAALGVREEAGRPVQQTLLRALAPRRLVLVLDNCEHLVEAAAALVAGVLDGC